MIREVLKTIVNASNDAAPPKEAKRSGDPCVMCGQPTQSFCGMCVRANCGKPPICSFEESPACQRDHAKEKHRDGQIGETDPQWVG